MPGEINGWLGIFIVFDLLFLPRLNFLISIPASLIVVLAVLSTKSIGRNYLCVLLFIALPIFASVLVSARLAGSEDVVDNVKRALQLLSAIAYGFLFIRLANVRRVLTNLLRFFFIFALCALFIFYGRSELYAVAISNIYTEAASSLQDNYLYQRFPYIFADANSAGYYFAMILAGYLTLEKNWKWAVICVPMGLIAIASTQSRGAYIGAIAVAVAYFGSNRNLKLKLAILLLIILMLSGFGMAYSEEIAGFLTLSEARLDSEDDFGGGRFEKYLYFLDNINLLPFGTGYHLFREGLEFRPHSDFIRLNLAYGLFLAPALLYYVFPRRRAQLVIFIIFAIPFFINTIIDDYRLFCTYLIFYGLLGQDQALSDEVQSGAEHVKSVQYNVDTRPMAYVSD